MKIFKPKAKHSKEETVQSLNFNYEKSYYEPNDSSVMDNGWVQTNDGDKFNNYTEEY